MKTILDVKPFQETLNAGMCGPASLKIVLDYYGLDKSEGELAGLCNVDSDLGVDDKSIESVSLDLGFQVEIKNNSSFDDVEKWLAKGVPVIVDWFTRGRADCTDACVPDGHYSVVCGLDEDSIYLQDPEIGGIRKLSRKDFKIVWFDFTGPYIKPEELIIRQLIAIYK